MRELNEQELEQVAGGDSSYGQANAGSKATIWAGVYNSTSNTSVNTGYDYTGAYSSNNTFAAGYGVSVKSGSSSSASQYSYWWY